MLEINNGAVSKEKTLYVITIAALVQIQLYKVLLIIIKILPNLGYYEGPAYGEAKAPVSHICYTTPRCNFINRSLHVFFIKDSFLCASYSALLVLYIFFNNWFYIDGAPLWGGVSAPSRPDFLWFIFYYKYIQRRASLVLDCRAGAPGHIFIIKNFFME